MSEPDAPAERPAAPPRNEERRERFARLFPVDTRFADNDVYGHANNAVYYAWFDSVINRCLIADGGLDLGAAPAIGVCVESGCRYLRSVAYPDALEVGLRVAKLGRSSVRYELAVFRAGEPAAVGHFVHVFVDRETRRPIAMPAPIRAALERLVVAGV